MKKTSHQWLQATMNGCGSLNTVTKGKQREEATAFNPCLCGFLEALVGCWARWAPGLIHQSYCCVLCWEKERALILRSAHDLSCPASLSRTSFQLPSFHAQTISKSLLSEGLSCITRSPSKAIAKNKTKPNWAFTSQRCATMGASPHECSALTPDFPLR